MASLLCPEVNATHSSIINSTCLHAAIASLCDSIDLTYAFSIARRVEISLIFLLRQLADKDQLELSSLPASPAEDCRPSPASPSSALPNQPSTAFYSTFFMYCIGVLTRACRFIRLHPLFLYPFLLE